MVADLAKKVKIWCLDNKRDLVVALIICSTGLSGFGLGRLSVDLKPLPPLFVVEPALAPDIPANSLNSASAAASGTDARVFASRTGAVYYYEWCSGAKRVKEENRIWFPDQKMAEEAGLRRASTCR